MKYSLKKKFVQTMPTYNWLWREVGIEDVDWHYDWINGIFYFKDEGDKVKFILRWV